jgi:hypothetical protein
MYWCGNKLNSVVHSIYHIWCTGCYIPTGVFIEYSEFTSTVNTREREKVVHLTYLSSFFQGPLFQQRPYPSPGAVLRRNAELAGQQGKPTGLNYAPIQKRGDGSDGLGDAD